MTIKTKYNISDRVCIVELKINGVVKGFFIDDNSIQYQVRYFKEQEAKNTYFYDFELEPYKELIKEVGFCAK
jgi:hypothetical protein